MSLFIIKDFTSVYSEYTKPELKNMRPPFPLIPFETG